MGLRDRTHLGTPGTPRSPSSQARFSRLTTQQTPSSFQATYHAWPLLGGPDAVPAAPMPKLLGEMQEETMPP